MSTFLFLNVFVGLTFAVGGLQTVTDVELERFSEHLLTLDVNNAAKHIVISPQGRTNAGSRRDEASKPLLIVDRRVYEIPTISKMLALYDNYIADTLKDEVVTNSEKKEETALLDALLNTTVMSYTKNWLQTRGYVPKSDKEFRQRLEDIWFTLYSRGHHKKSSSGFEHIFMGEIKNNQVSGFHSWIFFNHEEKRNNLNYLGWMKKLDFSQKMGSIMKIHYDWSGVQKPVGTLFIGTSPEIEFALYTVCFHVRPNNKCNISLGGKKMFIQTYKFSYNNNKQVLSSGYPGI